MKWMRDAVSILINEAMIAKRISVLNAQPWQRTENKTGHANEFKDKFVLSKIGKFNLNIPQVRGGVEFYPSALEKGIRSELTLQLALNEFLTI